MHEFSKTDRIDARLAEPFVVVLPDNGPGGYVWRVGDLPPAIRVRRENTMAPAEGAPGASGSKLFELEAAETGTYTIRFERRREWEPGADRERIFVVNVGEEQRRDRLKP